jgi:hypothetical protein
MTPTYCSYDGNITDGVNPYRPGIDTVGGASFVDDSQYPPDPTEQLTALVENQNEMLLVALSKVTPAAIIYVKVTAGTPSIFGLRSASSILTTSHFTVTDLAIGKTELTCPATRLIQPFACFAAPQATGDLRASGYVNGSSTGIVIETRNSAGTLTDCDFVAIWM